MVDRDVLIQKVNSIQNCLKRIHDITTRPHYSLENLDAQDIIVLNLQRAIQLVIDIAFHIISEEKLGLPDNLKNSFVLLRKNNIIPTDLTEKMEKMIGFRNIAVHEYQSIDSAILQKIIDFHLKDLEEFYTIILERYR